MRNIGNAVKYVAADKHADKDIHDRDDHVFVDQPLLLYKIAGQERADENAHQCANAVRAYFFSEYFNNWIHKNSSLKKDSCFIIKQLSMKTMEIVKRLTHC